MAFKFNPFTRELDCVTGNSPSGSYTVEELFTVGEYDNGDSGAAATIDFTNGSSQAITLTADCTLTVTVPTNSRTGKLTLRVIQDTTGGWTLTYPAGTKAASGTAPTLSSSASAQDIIVLYYDGSTLHVGPGIMDTQTI